MKVANVFLGKTLGGIEQAFLDYTRALRLKGCDVVDFVHKDGLLKDKIPLEVRKRELPFRKRSPVTFYYLFQAVKSEKPDLILVHYKKSLGMFRLIGKMLGIPVVGVAHNPKTKHIIKSDFVFSVTEYQRQVFLKAGYPADRIFVVPNMIEADEPFVPFKGFREPPVIGVIGRFDPMKGFDTFVEALAVLKRRGVAFKAKMAGSVNKTYEAFHKKVLALISENGLENDVETVGWIEDKKAFYESLDVFVMSSNFEPFGIVVLEALKYSRPVVSSTAEGPSEIFEGTDAALMFEKGNAEALANALERMLSSCETAASCAREGYALLKRRFDLSTSGASALEEAIRGVMSADRRSR